MADSAVPVVAIGHVEDPEGDSVVYDIVVARDAELTDVFGSIEGLAPGAGPLGGADQTTWQLTARLNGTYYWSARAVDDQGAASDWAAAWSFSFDDSDPLPPVDDTLTGGCDSCESSLADGSVPTAWALLLLLVPVLRRRRA